MRRIASLAIILWLAAALPAAAQQGDPARGRKIAEQHCSRCHVVAGFNPHGGIGSTPSFAMLVRHLKDYQDRFQTFYARRPHPAFLTVKGVGRPMEHLPTNAAPVEITEQDVADVAAYADKLRAELPKDKKPLVYSPRPKPRMR